MVVRNSKKNRSESMDKKMEKPGRKIVEEYWADGEWHYVYSNND